MDLGLLASSEVETFFTLRPEKDYLAVAWTQITRRIESH